MQTWIPRGGEGSRQIQNCGTDRASFEWPLAPEVNRVYCTATNSDETKIDLEWAYVPGGGLRVSVHLVYKSRIRLRAKQSPGRKSIIGSF